MAHRRWISLCKLKKIPLSFLKEEKHYYSGASQHGFSEPDGTEDPHAGDGVRARRDPGRRPPARSDSRRLRAPRGRPGPTPAQGGPQRRAEPRANRARGDQGTPAAGTATGPGAGARYLVYAAPSRGDSLLPRHKANRDRKRRPWLGFLKIRKRKRKAS